MAVIHNRKKCAFILINLRKTCFKILHALNCSSFITSINTFFPVELHFVPDAKKKWNAESSFFSPHLKESISREEESKKHRKRVSQNHPRKLQKNFINKFASLLGRKQWEKSISDKQKQHCHSSILRFAAQFENLLSFQNDVVLYPF